MSLRRRSLNGGDTEGQLQEEETDLLHFYDSIINGHPSTSSSNNHPSFHVDVPTPLYVDTGPEALSEMRYTTTGGSPNMNDNGGGLTTIRLPTEPVNPFSPSEGSPEIAASAAAGVFYSGQISWQFSSTNMTTSTSPGGLTPLSESQVDGDSPSVFQQQPPSVLPPFEAFGNKVPALLPINQNHPRHPSQQQQQQQQAQPFSIYEDAAAESYNYKAAVSSARRRFQSANSALHVKGHQHHRRPLVDIELPQQQQLLAYQQHTEQPCYQQLIKQLRPVPQDQLSAQLSTVAATERPPSVARSHPGGSSTWSSNDEDVACRICGGELSSRCLMQTCRPPPPPKTSHVFTNVELTERNLTSDDKSAILENSPTLGNNLKTDSTKNRNQEPKPSYNNKDYSTLSATACRACGREMTTKCLLLQCM